MIDSIEIANFRAFSQKVWVRLRPITVLIGKNSAGKSTLIKFLLMLRQSLESAEASFLITEGRHVDLGGFKNLRNTTAEDGRLRFRLEIRSGEVPSGPMVQLLTAVKERQNRIGPPGIFRLNVELSNTPEVRNTLDALYDIQAEALYSEKPVGHHGVRVTAGEQLLFETKSRSLKNVRFLSFPSTTARPEGVLEALVYEHLLRVPRRVLVDLRHLSAVREESQRVIALANPPVDDVGHRGEFAISHLYKILERGGSKSEFIQKHIQAITNIDSLEFHQKARNFRSHFLGRNIDTNVHCFLPDFGFGVSQCLPIFVQGALLERGQLLIVEQPEAQVHPTAQLELGTFFVDLWQTFGVPSLIETHSPNIILRLRQLISNGLDPNTVSIAFFTIENKQVAVRNLDMYSNGRLEKGLPREFFGADVMELAKFGIPE